MFSSARTGYGPANYCSNIQKDNVTEQVLKLIEIVLHGRIRKMNECQICDEFRKRSGTADWLFALRQFVEKRSEMQWSKHSIVTLCLGSVDLATSFVGHTVSITLNWNRDYFKHSFMKSLLDVITVSDTKSILEPKLKKNG